MAVVLLVASDDRFLSTALYDMELTGLVDSELVSTEVLTVTGSTGVGGNYAVFSDESREGIVTV